MLIALIVVALVILAIPVFVSVLVLAGEVYCSWLQSHGENPFR